MPIEDGSASGEATMSASAPSGLDARTAKVLRLGLATGVALTIAQAYNWPLSFLAPVLVAALLEMPLPQPSLREFGKTLIFSLLMIASAFTVVLALEPRPLVFALIYPAILFGITYCLYLGAPLMPMLMGIVSMLIFPALGNIHEGLTALIALSVALSTVLAILIVQLAYGLLPPRSEESQSDGSPFVWGYHPHVARSTLIMTLVVSPLAIGILLFQSNASFILALIYASVMALEGNLAHGLYDVKKYLTATAIGATAVLPFYYLIVAVPEFIFFVPLSFLTLLLMASYRFSGSSLAPYFGSAMIAFTILISSSLGPGADIDANIFKRSLLIFLGGVYMATLMVFIEPFIKRVWPLEEIPHHH